MGKQIGQSGNSATSPPASAIRRASASSRSNPRAPSTTCAPSACHVRSFTWPRPFHCPLSLPAAAGECFRSSELLRLLGVLVRCRAKKRKSGDAPSHNQTDSEGDETVKWDEEKGDNSGRGDVTSAIERIPNCDMPWDHESQDAEQPANSDASQPRGRQIPSCDKAYDRKQSKWNQSK
jgi:hypothetical protein